MKDHARRVGEKVQIPYAEAFRVMRFVLTPYLWREVAHARRGLCGMVRQSLPDVHFNVLDELEVSADQLQSLYPLPLASASHLRSS